MNQQKPNHQYTQNSKRRRDILHAKKLTKSGHNKFANYSYFELSDFLPVTLQAACIGGTH